MTKPRSTITKSDPPQQRRTGAYDWTAIAEQLMADPGEWYQIYSQDSATFATAIRNRDINALKDPAFEWRTANNTRGRPHGHPDGFEQRVCDLWMRYNPPAKRKAKA